MTKLGELWMRPKARGEDERATIRKRYGRDRLLDELDVTGNSLRVEPV